MKLFRGSMISDFNKCPRAYYWRWEHQPNLELTKELYNPSVGSATHDALHLWYKHRLLSVPREDRLLFMHSSINGSRYDDEVKKEANRLVDCFYNHELIKDDEGFTVLRPETTIKINLIDPFGYALVMTLDGVVQMLTATPTILVLEHKTSSVSRGPIIIGYLKSPQIISYVWGARMLGYNCVGGLFTFLVKTKEADILRLPTAISPALQARWRESLTAVFNLMISCREKNEWRQNLNSCYSIMGTCQYLPLCTRYDSASLEAYSVAPESEVREDYFEVNESETNQNINRERT